MKTTKVAVYVRVSTAGQTADNQLLELRQYVASRGWDAAEFGDVISGSTDKRPGLDAMMKDARCRRFSAIVIWSLDRLGRSLPHLVTLIAELETLGVSLVSLKEGLDMSTAAGKLQAHILMCLSEFERARLRERTIAGLQRARSQGTRLGRPRKAPVAMGTPNGTVRELAASWGVSKSTAARWLASGHVPAMGQTPSKPDPVSP